jgi:hypothetical protein
VSTKAHMFYEKVNLHPDKQAIWCNGNQKRKSSKAKLIETIKIRGLEGYTS